MLPKRQRLTKKDFPIRAARRVSFAFGSISFMSGSSRAAVVVSKKIAPSAVVRNTMRRRMYAALKPLLSPGRAIVVYPNKKAITAKAADLRAALKEILS